ncbi:MAG TPA: hypothetical protein VJX67_22410, partial [Blastocatellia bacterium]|nr:hypothetical protein [Blastocatellia bacterium]
SRRIERILNVATHAPSDVKKLIWAPLLIIAIPLALLAASVRVVRISSSSTASAIQTARQTLVPAKNARGTRQQESGTVRGDVAGGVEGGVPIGIDGGVDGGVNGGVDEGVAGGIDGAISGGVAGGIQCSLPADQDAAVLNPPPNQQEAPVAPATPPVAAAPPAPPLLPAPEGPQVTPERQLPPVAPPARPPAPRAAIPVREAPRPPAGLVPIAPARPIAPASPIAPAPPSPPLDFPRGESYVIVPDGSATLFMWASMQEAEHAKALQKKIGGGFIWLKHAGRAYLITDPATVRAATDLFALQDRLRQQQYDLSTRPGALGRKLVELDRRGNRVDVPDINANVRKIEARLKEAKTQSELSELRSKLAALRSDLSELQSRANAEQAALEEELSRAQVELSRHQSELSEEQSRVTREVVRKLRRLLDQAIDSGKAKPEP